MKNSYFSFIIFSFIFLFLHPTQNFPSLFSSQSILHTSLHSILSSSTFILQKQAGTPWISASHGMSRFSQTSHHLSPPPSLDKAIQQEEWVPKSGNNIIYVTETVLVWSHEGSLVVGSVSMSPYVSRLVGFESFVVVALTPVNSTFLPRLLLKLSLSSIYCLTKSLSICSHQLLGEASLMTISLAINL